MSSLLAPLVASIFISAMAFENAAKGLILSVKKFSVNQTPIPAIMIVANLLSIFFSPLYVWSNITTTDCQESSTAFKIGMHLFFISFSVFLLFKTYIVSQKRAIVAALAALLLVNRLTWATLDILRSKSVAIGNNGCMYMQDRLAIIGVASAGMLVDVFCTTTTVLAAFRDVDADASSKMHRIYQVLIADNVLRTLGILAVNAFTLNYALYNTLQLNAGSPTIMVLIPALSQLVYTQAMNVEFFWIGVRNDIMKAPEADEVPMNRMPKSADV